jgi:hypothetical protein
MMGLVAVGAEGLDGLTDGSGSRLLPATFVEDDGDTERGHEIAGFVLILGDAELGLGATKQRGAGCQV